MNKYNEHQWTISVRSEASDICPSTSNPPLRWDRNDPGFWRQIDPDLCLCLKITPKHHFIQVKIGLNFQIWILRIRNLWICFKIPNFWIRTEFNSICPVWSCKIYIFLKYWPWSAWSASIGFSDTALETRVFGQTSGLTLGTASAGPSLSVALSRIWFGVPLYLICKKNII